MGAPTVSALRASNASVERIRWLTPNALYFGTKAAKALRIARVSPLVFRQSVAGGTPADRPRHPK